MYFRQAKVFRLSFFTENHIPDTSLSTPYPSTQSTQLCSTPSTSLRPVPLPQEGGINAAYQNKNTFVLSRFFEGSLLRELAAEGRLRE